MQKLRHSFLVTLLMLAGHLLVQNQSVFSAGLDSVAVFGLMHKPLGTAQLDTAVSPVGRSLVISNIGSSGQDGVSIDLGNSCGWDGFFIPLDVPDGGMIENTFLGSTGGGLPMEVASGMRVIGLGSGQGQLEAGFTGVTSITVDAYLGDAHVFHRSGVGSGPKMYSRDRFPWLLVCIIILAVSDFHNEEGDLEWDLETTFGGTASVQFPGGPTVSCDRIVMTPENPTVDYHTVERVELRGSQIPPFTIIGERLRMFGLPHASVGNALFSAEGGDGNLGTARKIRHHNLGSSGEDGVSIDLGKSKLYNVKWDSLDASAPLPDSASIKFTAMGKVSGSSNHPIGMMMCQRVGSLYELSADFSPLGATSMTAYVYNGGTLVDSVKNITSSMFATTFGCVDDDHWGRPIKNGIPGMGGSLTMFGPESFTFNAGGGRAPVSITGDEVVLVPEDATGEVESFSQVVITTADIPELSFTEESMTQYVTCGDPDGSGIVTISDVVFLIQYIFAGGPSPNPLAAGDADCNGIVTISDAVYLINYIFSGGPAPCASCL